MFRKTQNTQLQNYKITKLPNTEKRVRYHGNYNEWLPVKAYILVQGGLWSMSDLVDFESGDRLIPNFKNYIPYDV